MERKTKVYMACTHAHMFVTCLITCLSYGTSSLAVTCPCKHWGGHFGVLKGMWVFQHITLHRATNSAKSQAKIRFAFHFVERNYISTVCLTDSGTVSIHMWNSFKCLKAKRVNLKLL